MMAAIIYLAIAAVAFIAGLKAGREVQRGEQRMKDSKAARKAASTRASRRVAPPANDVSIDYPGGDDVVVGV
jgi:hypothetical protein